MKLTVEREGKSAEMEAHLSIDFIELIRDKLDEGLIQECNESDNITDKLLALETIVRRIEAIQK